MNLDGLIYPQDGWGYMPPTEEIFNIFKDVKDICNPKIGLEIGFYLGHSTTYQLEIFKDMETLVSISPLDFYASNHEMHRRKSVQAERLKNKYKNRWHWLSGYTGSAMPVAQNQWTLRKWQLLLEMNI